ncbi:hypothetical protein SAMN05216564_12112 [Halopenitus persicus]|uniref:Uncharacterized protein n=1 Tax=Halopenitus persicus TaxID=1048396 RepID=A0A1H3PAQ7_9EURY|nr:hypothetical protein SAMN05216564_12112 [Halopenitus persicus]
MRDLVERLPTILVLWSSYASDETSINEFSEVVSEVKTRIVDSLGEFFSCDFLTVPQIVQDRISPLITQRCFPSDVIRERPHVAAK